MWVRLGGLKHPIQFKDCEELVDILAAILRGWSITRIEDCKDLSVIQIHKTKRGYERRSPWIKRGTAAVHSDPVDSVCDLLLDIEHAFIEDSAHDNGELMLTLHAAGVEMGQGPDAGLVVFPSTHASGKSLLSTALAAHGHRIFADDQLPVIPGVSGLPTRAISPGFLPRLRRPLPETLGAELTDFIRTNAGPVGHRFRYIDLKDDIQAPLNAEAPIKAVVLLEREDGAKPTLRPAKEMDVFKACILHSFGRKLKPLDILDNMQILVEGAECHALSYSDAQEAVALLEYTFG